jgi:Ca2+-binding RTX toxin-like protein
VSRRSLILAGALLCMLVACPPALAATASVSQGRLTVTGAPGEVNDLLITQQDGGDDDDGGSVRVRESAPGASLAAGSYCEGVGPNEVRCSSVDELIVNAGDGNDKVVNYTWTPSRLTGGRGNDQLNGGGGADLLDGQEDADTLLGGYGNDDLRGGSGLDTVTYSYAWYPIVADPDGNADDGAVGGHDNVRPDVENLTGGRDSDRLYGNAGANALNGAEGDDALYGAEGNDTVVGGQGRDTLRGEAGDDSLDSLDGGVDSSGCGDGSDSLLADPSDERNGDCEAVSFGIEPPAPGAAPEPVRVTRRAVRVTSNGFAPLRLRCTRAARGGCFGNVTLTLPTRARKKAKVSAAGRPRRQVVVGKARFSIRSGRLATVKVRLSRNGRRRVLRRKRIRCKVSVAVRQGDGIRATVTGVLTLKAPEVSAP